MLLYLIFSSSFTFVISFRINISQRLLALYYYVMLSFLLGGGGGGGGRSVIRRLSLD